MPRRYRLRGPLESKVQRAILDALGWPEREPWPDKHGKPVFLKSGALRMRDVGIWRSRGGDMFWRANSGGGKNAAGFRVKGNPAGTADIIGIVCGRIVALEVKRDESSKQSANQKRWQRWCEAAGGTYAVVRSPSEARAVVDELRARAAQEAA